MLGSLLTTRLVTARGEQGTMPGLSLSPGIPQCLAAPHLGNMSLSL